MKRLMPQILLVMTCVPALCGLLNADDFEIRGHVVDDSDPPQPVEAAHVMLSVRSQPFQNADTDATGAFTLQPEQQGTHVTFELLVHQGRRFEPWTSQTLTAKRGTLFHQDGITLKRFTKSTTSIRQITIAEELARRADPNSRVARDLRGWLGDLKEKKPLELTVAEKKAVENCLNIIRGCQLPDGAFVMKNHGKNAESIAWIPPYFANYAALAILAGSERKKVPSDLARIAKWLDWCAKNQTADGYWHDFEGTISRHQSNGKVDAWDSSAALFLIVAERFQRSGERMTPAVITAAKKSLACIQMVTDQADGLTWAKPTYKVKFLMDNIETYAGLVAATRLFARLGAKEEQGQARQMVERIEQKLPGFWQQNEKLFAFALHQNGAFEAGMDQLYPHGLAQLFAIGFLDARTQAWQQVQAKFLPDDGDHAAAGPERWLIAASRMQE